MEFKKKKINLPQIFPQAALIDLQYSITTKIKQINSDCSDDLSQTQ